MKQNILFVLFAVTCLWLLLPVFLPLTISFSSQPTISFPPKGFTLKWFYDALSMRDFILGFRLSLTIALSASAIALALSLPVSYSLWKKTLPLPEIWERIYDLPIVIPQMVLGFGLFLLIFKQFGLSSLAGLLLGHIFIVSPYAMRNLYAGLSLIDPGIEDAAVTLGASRVRAFLEVVLPNAKNAIFSAFISCFLISFNAVEISLFLSVGGVSTLPVAMLNFLVMRWDPAISALSTVLVMFTIALVTVSDYLLGGKK